MDEHVSQGVHLSPGDLRIRRTKLGTNLPGCLANNLKITANGIEEDGNGDITPLAKVAALNQFLTTIPDVQ
ncbi:MAG TPA: hypothetical protein VGL97_20795 [Bryobacteraceae bacterium]